MNIDNDNSEYEVAKEKGKIIAITTFSIIGLFIITVIIIIMLGKFYFAELFKQKYHVLDVTKNNKQQIISLLKQENYEYCESLYKIEYTQGFMGDISVKIYCNNEDHIDFGIYDNKSNELTNYIWKNGITEKR